MDGLYRLFSLKLAILHGFLAALSSICVNKLKFSSKFRSARASTIEMRKDFSVKTLNELKLDEIVSVHLDSRSTIETSDMILVSCLHSAEIGMQQSRGINLLKNHAPLLLGYSILDQLGNCYSDKRKPALNYNKSGIIKAFDHFGPYASGSPESDAIYLLRNCLVHDSSLAGKNKKDQHALFRYDWKQPEAIRLPQISWDGTAKDLSKDRVTWVNPRRLTDEISSVLSSVRELESDRPQDLKVHLTRDDILHKFIFWAPKT